ncbi:unnamed protein product [Heligmosomoides polygyrus]|uniref:Uncharacterized protein n=1 Tax=Heligmosomoides polygyrus TaxID=6339 RepID=A0A183GJ63_HELPZ|nr:unnamed protein product [Heligmosomoides polygyrus]
MCEKVEGPSTATATIINCPERDVVPTLRLLQREIVGINQNVFLDIHIARLKLRGTWSDFWQKLGGKRVLEVFTLIGPSTATLELPRGAAFTMQDPDSCGTLPTTQDHLTCDRRFDRDSKAREDDGDAESDKGTANKCISGPVAVVTATSSLTSGNGISYTFTSMGSRDSLEFRRERANILCFKQNYSTMFSSNRLSVAQQLVIKEVYRETNGRVNVTRRYPAHTDFSSKSSTIPGTC